MAAFLFPWQCPSGSGVVAGFRLAAVTANGELGDGGERAPAQ